MCLQRTNLRTRNKDTQEEPCGRICISGTRRGPLADGYYPPLTNLLLVTVFAKTLLALVSRHLMSFPFLSARHVFTGLVSY